MFSGEPDTGQGWHFTGPRKPPLWPDWTCGEGKQEAPQALRDTSGAIRLKEKRLLVWFSVPLTPTSRGRQSVCLCNPKFRRLLPLVNLCFRPRGRGTCALLSKCPDFIYGHFPMGSHIALGACFGVCFLQRHLRMLVPVEPNLYPSDCSGH